MLIAVASDDKFTVAPHLGKAAYFIFFEVEGGKVAGRTVRENPHAAVHAHEESQGGHGGGHGQAHPGHFPGHHHSHGDLLAALAGCDATISKGVGVQAAGELRDQGVEPFVLEVEATPEEAVGLFLQGKLRPVADRR